MPHRGRADPAEGRAGGRTLRTLIEFDDADTVRWESLGDGVFSLSESLATFEGQAAGDNADAAPSIRIAIEPTDLARFEGLALRAEGGGVPFDLCLRTVGGPSPGTYRARFDAPDVEFRQIRIPFAAMQAADAAPLDTLRVVEIGLAVSPVHTGPFRLQIEWIRAYGFRGA